MNIDAETGKSGRSGEGEEAEPRLRRTLRPFRQGSLDAYCGFYAILNSMYRLTPETFRDDEDFSRDLILSMMKAATRVTSGGELLREGMDGIELEYVARAAIRFMARRGMAFKLQPVSRHSLSAYRDRRTEWLEGFLRHPSRSLIVYVNGEDGSHWSVLDRIKGKRAVLFDSDGMSSALLPKCEPQMVIAQV